MSINAWLCKTFDEDKRGYVTISNIVPALFCFFSIIGIILLLLFGLNHIISGNVANPNYIATTPSGVLGIVGTALWVLILTFVLMWLGVCILNMKIARCKLKKEDK